jgi:beta-lactamase regulating signal transducer with metallopeptidase domain
MKAMIKIVLGLIVALGALVAANVPIHNGETINSVSNLCTSGLVVLARTFSTQANQDCGTISALFYLCWAVGILGGILLVVGLFRSRIKSQSL